MLYVGRNTVAPNNVINTGIEQVQSDYAQVDTTAVDYIKNKPTLASVATSGDYSDLSNTPTIPTVNDATLTITQNGTSVGTFTSNSSSDVTVDLTDTTYLAFTGADGVNAGSSGLVPAPTAVDNEKFLKGDGTWATVSGGGASYTAGNGINITNDEISVEDPVLVNNTTSSSSVAIKSNAVSSSYAVAIGVNATVSGNRAIAIGNGANAGNYQYGGIAIGCLASSNYWNSIALGWFSNAGANGAIQLGYGTNSTQHSFNVSNCEQENNKNWQLLNTDTGYIPNGRLDMDTTPTQSSTKPITSGAVYAALGDIETVLDAIIAQGSNA